MLGSETKAALESAMEHIVKAQGFLNDVESNVRNAFGELDSHGASHDNDMRWDALDKFNEVLNLARRDAWDAEDDIHEADKLFRNGVECGPDVTVNLHTGKVLHYPA